MAVKASVSAVRFFSAASRPTWMTTGVSGVAFHDWRRASLRRPGLMEALQREHKVMLVGPTTLLATLNSLQMGFRTLALEKRSAEVWEVLGAVKTEFGKFGEILAKTRKKVSLEDLQKILEQGAIETLNLILKGDVSGSVEAL